MTCQECNELLDDAVDGSLGPSAEASLLDHCAHCDACRTLLADLQAIRRTAAKLERRAPSPEVWQRISERTIHRRSSWLPLAAAAALVAALGGGWLSVSLLHRPQQVPADASALASSAEAEMRQAEAHYEKAIAALEQLTANKQTTLDPRVDEA